jgi:hypothetical protein
VRKETKKKKRKKRKEEKKEKSNEYQPNNIIDLPRKHQNSPLVLSQDIHPSLDMFDKSRRLSMLVAFYQPFGLVPAILRPARPNGVPADDDQVIWCHLFSSFFLRLAPGCRLWDCVTDGFCFAVSNNLIVRC